MYILFLLLQKVRAKLPKQLRVAATRLLPGFVVELLLAEQGFVVILLHHQQSELLIASAIKLCMRVFLLKRQRKGKLRLFWLLMRLARRSQVYGATQLRQPVDRLVCKLLVPPPRKLDKRTAWAIFGMLLALETDFLVLVEAGFSRFAGEKLAEGTPEFAPMHQNGHLGTGLHNVLKS